MNKKIIIIIIISFVIVISILFLLKTKNKKVTNENNNVEIEETEIEHNIKSVYIESSGIYEIRDEATGEVLVQTMSESEAKTELEFYQKYPEYRESAPGKDSYISISEIPEN